MSDDNHLEMFFPARQVATRALVVASTAYLANSAVATWVAISNDIPGRPFGIKTGLPNVWDFAFGLGTGLSAPLSMLIALAVLTVAIARHQRHRYIPWIGFLGCCFLAGMLAEPILGEAMRGERGQLVTGIVVANVLLPIVIIGLTIRIARQTERDLPREALRRVS